HDRRANTVRKHLSLLKGGQLARAAAPATVLTLALSDVIGNAVDVIASGPTAPDPSTYAQALAVVRRFGLEGRAPRSVLDRLEAGAAGRIPETPKPDDRIFARVTNLVIGDNSLVVAGAAARAAALGYAPEILTRTLARAACRRLDPHSSLAANDSHAFFRATGDLVMTGPTGTNLLDLYLLVAERLRRD